MSDVRKEVLTVNHDVVEEDDNKFAQVRFECVVHGGLEGRGGVTETKWHNTKFVVALVRAKCSFGKVEIRHTNLMKTLP